MSVGPGRFLRAGGAAWGPETGAGRSRGQRSWTRPLLPAPEAEAAGNGGTTSPKSFESPAQFLAGTQEVECES